jgi:hypothetical protein
MMRGSVRILPLVVGACAVAGSDSDVVQHLGGPGGHADIRLASSQVSLLQTSDTAWSLAKTGSVDSIARTVTWTLVATKGATTGGHLVVDGYLNVQNKGNGPATIGNIVASLQTRVNGHWVTQVSDVADATHGDAATSANIVGGVVTEGPGSGTLSFMDRATNTVFSLVPEVSVPAHTTERLLFAATFDNNQLHLATGTQTRTQVTVTFGNHPNGGGNHTDENVDINGNGVIDPDEAKVRSVTTQFETYVPSTQAANATVTLADSAADITSSGTVTFGTPLITLGATSGTVTVSYDPGASGGSITNCGHATGHGITDPVGSDTFVVVSPVELDACNTQTIVQHTCVPGAPGCGWHDGDMLTYSQANWGDATSNAGTLLAASYDTTYQSTLGVFEIGIPGAGGFSVRFSSESHLQDYLPASGAPAALDSDMLDPLSTSAGVFGGEVSGLKLNVDFSDAGVLHGTAAVKLGDLTLCNMALAGLNNTTVRDFLAMANTALGGGATPYAITDLDPIANQLNGAFGAGAASTFAQQSLVNGACP